MGLVAVAALFTDLKEPLVHSLGAPSPADVTVQYAGAGPGPQGGLLTDTPCLTACFPTGPSHQ